MKVENLTTCSSQHVQLIHVHVQYINNNPRVHVQYINNMYMYTQLPTQADVETKHK